MCMHAHHENTAFTRLNAAAFITFELAEGVALIRGRRLFKGGVYLRAALNRENTVGLSFKPTF